MILAGIDIGTNTLRLLVAETGPGLFHEIYSTRTITRLGQGLDQSGMLSPDAEERALNALMDFAGSVREHGAHRVAAIGTSALRNASNARDFIEKVKQRTGFDITVITGEEEARLTLLGVAQALKGPGKQWNDPLISSVVIDIGGGSTEIILTRPKTKPHIISLPLGAVYLTERFIKHDPPSLREIQDLRSAITDMLALHCGGMIPDPESVFIGTAGTITTLTAMDQKLVAYDPEKINGHTMMRVSVDGIVNQLIATTLKERRSLPGLEIGREDIILSGAIITQEIMKHFGFSKMIVSDWGLREGIVLDLYRRINLNHK